MAAALTTRPRTESARGIRVKTVSPGPVATDLWLGAGGVPETVARATGTSPDEVKQAAHSSATGRFTRPAEVADLVLCLASDRTANVTGADITIDGGLVPIQRAGQARDRDRAPPPRPPQRKPCATRGA